MACWRGLEYVEDIVEDDCFLGPVDDGGRWVVALVVVFRFFFIPADVGAGDETLSPSTLLEIDVSAAATTGSLANTFSCKLFRRFEIDCVRIEAVFDVAVVVALAVERRGGRNEDVVFALAI